MLPAPGNCPFRLGRNNLYKCRSCINAALKSEDEISAEGDSDALTLNLSHLVSSKQSAALIKRAQGSVTQEKIPARSMSEGFTLSFHTLRGPTSFTPNGEASVASKHAQTHKPPRCPEKSSFLSRLQMSFENFTFSCLFSEWKTQVAYLLTALPLSPCSRAPR